MIGANNLGDTMKGEEPPRGNHDLGKVVEKKESGMDGTTGHVLEGRILDGDSRRYDNVGDSSYGEGRVTTDRMSGSS